MPKDSLPSDSLPSDSLMASTRIRATYDESEVMFDLPRTATLEQLATMLATAGRGHGPPVSIEVILEPEATS